MKGKNKECNLSSLVGESVSEADERDKCEQKRKSGFYRAALNTCLSFLNGRKRRSGIAI